MKNDWLKKLRDRMADYEMDAPDGLWDAIEKSSAGKRDAAANIRRVVPANWRRAAALAAAAAVAGVLLWKVFTPASPLLLIEPASDAPLTSDVAAVSGESPELRIADAVTAKPQGRRTLSQPSANSISGPQPDVQPIACSDTTATAPDTIFTAPEPKKPLSSYDRYHDEYHALPPLPAKKTQHKFVVGLNASGMKGAGGNAGTQSDRFPISDCSHGNCLASPNPTEDALSSRRAPAKLPEMGKADFHHKMPVRAALSLSYQPAPRWMVGTGVTYSYLQSDIDHQSFMYKMQGQQQLHYMGVPLNVSYLICSWRRLNIYVSAGGAAEKMISGKMSAEYKPFGIRAEHISESFEEKPWQFSVNAAMGAQLDITPAIGLYVEPGVSHYFDDHSELNTIYKDRPWTFNLNFGLRFTIATSKR